VTVTLDSSGLPQSRSGSGTTPSTYVAPTVVTTPSTVSQSGMPICSFVELMINIGAVTPARAPVVRSTLNCPLPQNSSTPSVDLKINGQNGSLDLALPKTVNVSWTSSGVTSCVGSSGSVPLSGSQNLYIDSPRTLTISCTGPLGPVSDSVIIASDASNADDLSVSCYADPVMADLTDLVTWKAEVNDSTNSYKTYSWSGDDDLSGFSQEISKNYSQTGLKKAVVTVTSGTNIATSSCYARVDQNDSISTDSNQVTVDLKINLQDNYIDLGDATNKQYLLSWSTENADNCVSSSIPNILGWGGVSRLINGNQLVSVPSATTFNMTCSNDSSFATDSVTLSFNNNLVSATTTVATTTNGWGFNNASSTYSAGWDYNAYLAALASSTESFSTYTQDELFAEARSLDAVLVSSDNLNCLAPIKNHAIVVNSTRDKKIKKYIWVWGESQLVDNMGGAIVGNIIGDGEGESEDATYEPMGSMPTPGMYLNLVLGDKVKCTVYGSGEKILKAYLTVQGEDWVKEQEGMSTSTDSQ